MKNELITVRIYNGTPNLVISKNTQKFVNIDTRDPTQVVHFYLDLT